MEDSEMVLRKVLSDKRGRLQILSSRKVDLDAEVAKLENEVAKLEGHLVEVFPKVRRGI